MSHTIGVRQSANSRNVDNVRSRMSGRVLLARRQEGGRVAVSVVSVVSAESTMRVAKAMKLWWYCLYCCYCCYCCGWWGSHLDGKVSAFVVVQRTTSAAVRVGWARRKSLRLSLVEDNATMDKTQASSSLSSSPFDNGMHVNGLTPGGEAVESDEEEVVLLPHTDEEQGEYRLSTDPSAGPAGSVVHTLTFLSIPGQEPQPPLVVETGKIGRLAAGAVTVSLGDTVLYSTACRDDEASSTLDFVPLSVEHTERFSAAGLTSGSFHKRDGRPAEHEILTARVIDRPIRPLLPSNWRHETQLQSWVLSYDPSLRSCDPLAVLSSSAALFISDIPYSKPVAAVEVGMVEVNGTDPSTLSTTFSSTLSSTSSTSPDATLSTTSSSTFSTSPDTPLSSTSSTSPDTPLSSTSSASPDTTSTTTSNTTPHRKYYKLVVNPTIEQMDNSPLHLIVAGTAQNIMMIEGSAQFLPESIFVEAIRLGQKAIRTLCHGIMDFGKLVANDQDKPKYTQFMLHPPPLLQQRVDDLYTEMVDQHYAKRGLTKKTKGKSMSALYDSITNNSVLQQEFPDLAPSFLYGALKHLLVRRMYHTVAKTGFRDDGRTVTAIRPLTMATALLPRVHGSALFTRGETQTIATTTLGDSSMRQKIDTIDGINEKRFYLQYTFPPSCVGETGRLGSPGRREVGHGNLAERALFPAIPPEHKFPYSIRVESLVTESHGSSSMASVCGGCLSLMDAGVPLTRPVAGIAMGMLLCPDSNDNHSNSNHNDANAEQNSIIVLTDITGTEDALGTMDFKVAGDETGISAFQLDIKCEGLTVQTLERALEQARIGRLEILQSMKSVMPRHRSTLPATVPKMASFSIPVDSIGKVIGPGGKQIRSILEDFSLVNMDVKDDGTIQLTSFQEAQLAAAEAFVKNLIAGGGRAGGRNANSLPNSGPPGGAGTAFAERPKYSGPEPVVGQIYSGKITGVHPFGVFVEFMPPSPPQPASSNSTVDSDDSIVTTGPGLEGLVHVSELATRTGDRIRNCEAFIRSMNVTELTVKYIGTDARGKHKLTRRGVQTNVSPNSNNYNNKSGPAISSHPNNPTTTTTTHLPKQPPSTINNDTKNTSYETTNEILDEIDELINNAILDI